MRQWKMRAAIAKRLTHRDPFGIERIGHAADRRLRALLVNVPSLEMLDRARIHHDQRWMDDWSRVHQRARQGIATWFNYTRKSAADDVERVRRVFKRKNS